MYSLVITAACGHRCVWQLDGVRRGSLEVRLLDKVTAPAT